MIKLQLPKKLSWKLFVAIIPPVIIAVGGIVWLQYNRARREMLASIDMEMGLLAQRTASSVDDLLAERYRDLATLAETPLLADYYRNVDFGLRDEAASYRKELGRYLRRFLARGRVYAHILYLNAEGRVVCRVDGGSGRTSEATAFTAADFHAVSKLRAGGRWNSGVRGLPGGGRVIYFAQSISDDLGARKGVLVLGYDLGQLHRLLSSIAVGQSGGAFIRTPPDGMIEGRGGLLGADDLFATRPVASLPWTVVVRAPLDDFLAPLRAVRDEAAATALFVGALLIGLLLWLVRSITRPIEALVAAAREIGAGRLEHRIQKPGSDEIGVLARAFNEMAEKLESTRRAQTELQSQLIQSEKLSAVGQMISAVAHELNNPLGAIVGYAQVLLLEDFPPHVREDLEHIDLNVERCRKIVENLLFFARKSRQERKRVDLGDAATAATELLSYRLKKTEGVNVVWEFAADVPLVLGDFQQLVQVLVNLIANACDAMDGASRAGGKRLTLRTRATEERVFLEVEDNGPGIPPEIKERIFEAFFTTKELGKGTGLGLPICRQIVRDHGGDIVVDSVPGRGTVFRLDFPPASAGPSESDEEPETEPELASVPGRRVLVAEDERGIADLVARLMRGDGDEVQIARDGGEALRLLKENAYDLVISDIEMEHAKGPELHAALINPAGKLSTPMLFITGDVLNPKVVNFLADSGCPFLAKPFDIGDLRQAARRLLAAGNGRGTF